MLFGFFRSLGGLGEIHFWKIAGIVCGLAAGYGFALGGLAVALGLPDRTIVRGGNRAGPL